MRPDVLLEPYGARVRLAAALDHAAELFDAPARALELLRLGELTIDDDDRGGGVDGRGRREWLRLDQHRCGGLGEGERVRSRIVRRPGARVKYMKLS